MAREADDSFDLFIIDAFTSDAIPVHMLTAEAVNMYLAKAEARRRGAAAHLQPLPRSGLGARRDPQEHLPPGTAGIVVSDNTADGSYGQSTSTTVVFAKSEEALAPYRADGRRRWIWTTAACAVGRTTTPTSWGRSSTGCEPR